MRWNLSSSVSAKRIALIAAVVLWLSGTATALNCPRNLGCGIVGCACGDTVVSSFQLTSNITCPAGHTGFGLKVASGVSLGSAPDQLYRVIGPGTMGASSYGILIENASSAAVLVVGVSGFRDGVHVQNSTNTVLWGVDANGNGAATDSAGISVDGGSGTQIAGCVVDNNADQGLRLSNTSGTVVIGSYFRNNGNENIHLLNANGGQLSANTTEGGAASLHVKHSNENALSSNLFQGGEVAFLGSSADNDFGIDGYGNEIAGGRLDFRQADNGEPSGNRVLKPTISNTSVGATHCISFASDPASSPQELPVGVFISEAELSCNDEELHVTSGFPQGSNPVCACVGTGGGTCDVALDPGAPDIIAFFGFPCL